jgi:hypothetical protein
VERRLGETGLNNRRFFIERIPQHPRRKLKVSRSNNKEQ